MSTKNIAASALALLLLLNTPLLHGQSRTETEKEVLKTVETLFEAMTESDSAKAADLFLEGGHSFRVERVDGELDIRHRTNKSFVKRIGKFKKGSVEERIWNARVEVEDHIAMVWAPYDLHVDKQFSHCGIDLISLVKTGGGWKIADITYTVRRENCYKGDR